MKTKLSTILILGAATQFAAMAAAGDTATINFSAPGQGDPLAMMPAFVVTAPRITSHDLQLRVATERAVRLLRSPADQVLANRFQAEFKAKGFAGNVDFLSATDTPLPVLPLLEIKLANWRATPGKLSDIRFSATLVTSQGKTWLGDYEGFSAPLAGTPSAKAQVDGLRTAATHAVDDVYRDLQTRHVLAGASQ